MTIQKKSNNFCYINKSNYTKSRRFKD